jgi:hypothetical protein
MNLSIFSEGLPLVNDDIFLVWEVSEVFGQALDFFTAVFSKNISLNFLEINISKAYWI